MSRILIDNRYSLGDLLGIGGTAEVYLAHDEILDRDVALKVLRSQHAENEEFIKLFRREARSAAALNHPNVVPVYYWGRSEDGRYYMTMEYVSGGTLKDRVGESLNPSTVIRLGLQVADALGFAHERGVVHRDVKPHNILLTEAGEARVADFGIARAANATTTSQLSPLMGTAGYLSPEQAKGESVGPASDLYSLGVVLYEALTGELPLNAEDPVALAMKHVNELPRSPREANPKVPNDLAALTLKLLAKRPEDRYPSAYALAQDLERVRHGLPPTIAPSEETTQNMSTPLLPGEEDQTRKIAVQLPVSGRPAWKPEHGRRIHSRLFTILAALLLGLVLLGGLGWALSLYL
jgi:serine/threonine-protein kinase